MTCIMYHYTGIPRRSEREFGVGRFVRPAVAVYMHIRNHMGYGIHLFDWLASAKPAATDPKRAYPARMAFGPGGLW